MEKNNNQKRQIAYKTRIRDIVNGKYIKQEGWQPNYIITPNNRQVSRVNMLGVVVSKPVENGDNYNSIVIDDGSGKISARVFDDSKIFDNIEIGDVALVIGRPREYGQEKYIVPEIIKKIKNKEWIEVRKLELKKEDAKKPEIKPEEIKENSVMVENISEEKIDIVENVGEEKTGSMEKVYNLIKSMDNGDGVDYQDIVEKTNAEKEIKILLREGEIYEIKPGRLRVL